MNILYLRLILDVIKVSKVMKIRTIIEDEEYTRQIRLCGLRNVARETKIDVAYVSRAVNNKIIVSKETLKRMMDAVHKLGPSKRQYRRNL